MKLYPIDLSVPKGYRRSGSHAKKGIRGFQTVKNKRNNYVAIRFTDEELSRLDFLCKQYDLTRADVLRELVLAYTHQP